MERGLGLAVAGTAASSETATAAAAVAGTACALLRLRRLRMLIASTAVGMADHVEVMIAAVIVAVALMFVASGPISGFVARHPTTTMLALAFLLLIGVSLVADGVGFHIDKGYIYAAMGFAVLVEAINIVSKQRRLAAASDGAALKPVRAAATGAVPVETITEPGAKPPRPRSNATGRAQSRPKSAPRKKS